MSYLLPKNKEKLQENNLYGIKIFQKERRRKATIWSRKIQRSLKKKKKAKIN